MESILYIFLPCKKVYPIGVTYLADFIHRRKPEVRQRIVDLSLFPDAQRIKAVRDAAPSSSRTSSVSPGATFRFSPRMRETRRWNMRLISTLRAIP
jgi:hypothetical protein